jgi:hypothetical protein
MRLICVDTERELAALGQLNYCDAGPVGEHCEYCSNGKRTGLPNNACENCMNTGLKHPMGKNYGA